RFVALAPGIARPGILLDDDGGNLQALQPRTQRNAALAAADDQAIRLPGIAEFGLVLLLAFEPALALADHAMLGAHRPGRTFLFLEALQLGHAGEEGPAFIALEAQQAAAPRHGGLEAEPGLGDAIAAAGLTVDLPVRGLRLAEGRLQHRIDILAAFAGLDVP